MKQKDKDKLKVELEAFMQRPSTEDEQVNAEKDPNLMIMVILNRLDELEDRIKKLNG